MSVLAELSRDLAGLVARAAPGVVGIEHGRGHGSGVVLSPDGYVLTNAHVVRGGGVKVRLSGVLAVPGDVVGTDDRTDLAVVRTEASGLQPLGLAEAASIEVGQLVLAIGNPVGFDRSVSVGVVSALYRDLPTPGGGVLEGLVQTDAAINPGNSGGPLVDVEGRVVGINTAMLAFARGIGFAVPAPTASWVAAVLLQHGEVRRPYLGILARSEELDAALAVALGRRRAVRILRVEAGTPAALGGLSSSDLLFSANASAVRTLDDLSRVMVLAAPPAVELEVLRDGATRRLTVFPRAHAA